MFRILYLDNGQTSIDFTNCIFWGNNGDLTDNDAALNVQYSIVEESGYPGTDNLYADPHFADTLGGNLRVRQGSPTVDAGDDSAVASGVTTDLDDLERFVGWVTRSNMTGFSDWAVGNDVGPTAIAVQNFDALGTDLSALVVIPLIVLGTILVLRRTQR